MAAYHGHEAQLTNDTALNVAALLKEPVGSTRTYRLHLDTFPLSEDLSAADVNGRLKLTRLKESVMASVRASGIADLECVRCLGVYQQPFTTAFDEEFHQTVDLRTGVALAPDVPVEQDMSTINENHELDVGEVLRQEILIALPMRPDCGAACPGPAATEAGEAGGGDERFAALSQLLNDEGAPS